jgi:hypothetical protein
VPLRLIMLRVMDTIKFLTMMVLWLPSILISFGS